MRLDSLRAPAPAPLRDGALRGGAAGRGGREQPGVRAPVPALDRWRHEAALRVPAAGGDDRRPLHPRLGVPGGTRFWKEFAFGGRKVETRLLWKATPDRWIAAAYVWNDAQTDAVLAPERGLAGVVEVAAGRRHSIPARADCAACHGSPARPLGFGALQLSTDRDPNAIHGEPLTPDMLTLATLAAEGRFAPARPEFVSAPPRIRTASPRTRAALGYLAANCGACHNRGGEITANLPLLAYEDVATDGDAVARSLVGRATRWQLPGAPEGSSVAVHAAAPDQSALVARMRSRRPSSQMPPLGTVVRDQQAVDAIAAWIESDLAPARIARH